MKTFSRFQLALGAMCVLIPLAPAYAGLVFESKRPPPLVYVTDFSSGDVYAFAQAGRNQHPVSTITGLGASIGLAVDARRNLYVAQSGAVLEFAPGGSKPIKTFDDTGHDVGGVAVCPNGTVFAANSEGFTISVYAGGATEPTDTLNADGQVFHVACDAASDIFVTVDGGAGQVDEFLANGSGPINLPMSIGFPEGIQIDREGDIVVAVASNNALAFYHVGQAKPFKSINVPGNPIELAFSKRDNSVWVTVSNAIQRYSVDTGRLTDTLETPANPGGLATSPGD